jgi:hypothetical protein
MEHAQCSQIIVYVLHYPVLCKFSYHLHPDPNHFSRSAPTPVWVHVFLYLQ